MARKLGPDGIPTEIPSTRVDPNSSDLEFDGDTPTSPHAEFDSDSLFPEEPPTAPAKANTKSSSPIVEEPMTAPVRNRERTPVSPDSSTTAGTTEQSDNEFDFLSDPIAGWVVIIEGPGKGAVRQLFYGKNNIGRDSQQKVALNFGDPAISRINHCSIEYDARDRSFYLNQGDGRNTPRLNGKRVAEYSVELKAHSIIDLGTTKLRFVPFCDDKFCWDDEDNNLGKDNR